jgi:hypothetical protein
MEFRVAMTDPVLQNPVRIPHTFGSETLADISRVIQALPEYPENRGTAAIVNLCPIRRTGYPVRPNPPPSCPSR